MIIVKIYIVYRLPAELDVPYRGHRNDEGLHKEVQSKYSTRHHNVKI